MRSPVWILLLNLLFSPGAVYGAAPGQCSISSPSLLEDPAVGRFVFDVSRVEQAATRQIAASNRKIWKPEPTLRDEFNGRLPEEKESCYTQPPVCQKAYSGGGECPPEVVQRVAKMNKCLWTISGSPAHKASNGEWISTHSHRNVEVTDYVYKDRITGREEKIGAMIIHSTATGITDTSNCAKQIDPDSPYSKGYTQDCPFLGASVWSRPMPELGVTGIQARFGRFEARARFTYAKAQWGAVWLMTPNAWPDTGEIDLMEWWSNNPHRIAGSLHSGKEWEEKGGKKKHPSRSVFITARELGRPNDTFSEDFHIYTVEWDPESIRFYVDDKYYSVITRETVKDMPIPTANGLYWILGTNTYEPDKKSDRADPTNFQGSQLIVDWVRTYTACESSEDFCPGGGTHVSTPGDEHCLYRENGQVTRKEAACADHRNLYAEYARTVGEDAGKNGMNLPYPNPYQQRSGVLTIPFVLKEPHKVQFNIIDMLGRKVAEIRPGQVFERGTHEVAWNGESDGGASLASAVYVVQMIIMNPDGSKAEQAGDGKKILYFK